MFRCETHYDATNKIWSGARMKEVLNPEITIGEAVYYSLGRNPKKIGQISDDDGVCLTNEEIRLRSLKIACYFTKLNLGCDDVVGLVAGNSQNTAPLIFGLLFCGVSINPLHSVFSVDEIKSLFQYTRPKVVFCDSSLKIKVKEVLERMGSKALLYTMQEDSASGTSTSVEHILQLISDKEALDFSLMFTGDGRKHTAFIICSSGSTGSPKGVRLSHASIIHSPMNRIRTGDDIILCFSALYWISGVANLLRGTLVGATRIITSEPFSPEFSLQLIEKYRVTMVAAPPSQLAMQVQCAELHHRDLSSLKEYFCAGGHMSPALCDGLHRVLQRQIITSGYGMTEIGSSGVSNRFMIKAGSVGCPMENLEVKIVDHADVSLGPNQQGEILLRPKYAFLGYIGPENSTISSLDADGWFHSGDIGYFDEDGFLFVIGRKKEIMKYKNFQLTPVEIENSLLVLSDISQVCVSGVPDMVVGDLPAALIVRKSGSSLSETDVGEHMKKNISDPKQLRGGIYFVEEIPMTPSGKYARAKVQKLVIDFYNKTH